MLYLSDSKLTPRHFYKGLLEQLGCESKFYRGDAKRQLHREIELMRGIHGLQPVVVVDEAHLLDREMLEEVRFLLNFKMNAQSPMALILVGQRELWERLAWIFAPILLFTLRKSFTLKMTPMLGVQRIHADTTRLALS